jgi:glutamyl-tRNA(Gln) amidotransferase subunit E
MYPETDVPVLALTEEHWNQVSADLPPTSVERRERLAACDLSQNQVDSLLGAELDDDFHAGHAGELAAGLDALPAKAWAALLLDRVRDEVAELAGAPDPECVPLSLIGLALSARAAGDITRDGIVPLATELLTSGAWNESGGEIEAVHALLLEAAASAGFVPAQSGEVEAAVEKVLAERAEFVAENGMQAMGPLMGVVMAELGGGADGKVVSAVLKEHLERLS